MNTLHEIEDKKFILKQINQIIKSGGEVIIAELLADEKYTIYGGCKKPLLKKEEIIKLFEWFGYLYIEGKNLQPAVKQKEKHPYYFFRFIKN